MGNAKTLTRKGRAAIRAYEANPHATSEELAVEASRIYGSAVSPSTVRKYRRIYRAISDDPDHASTKVVCVRRGKMYSMDTSGMRRRSPEDEERKIKELRRKNLALQRKLADRRRDPVFLGYRKFAQIIVELVGDRGYAKALEGEDTLLSADFSRYSQKEIASMREAREVAKECR